jgi:hypothetical protein
MRAEDSAGFVDYMSGGEFVVCVFGDPDVGGGGGYPGVDGGDEEGEDGGNEEHLRRGGVDMGVRVEGEAIRNRNGNGNGN